MKEKYLKLGFVLILAFLLLTAGFYVKELRQKEKLVKDYQKLSDLYNQKVFEYEKEIKELKEKGELIIKPEENLTPREVVEGFIKADMAGARLGGEIAKEAPGIERYLSSDFFYLGELVMVIKRYEIVNDSSLPKTEEGHRFAYVKVKFFCKEGVAPGYIEGARDIKTGKEITIEKMGDGPGLVSFDCSNFLDYLPLDDPSTNYDPKEQAETIIFELKKECGQWKVNSPSILPHISEETLKKHLESFK